MRLWLHKHRIVGAVIGVALALGAIECILLFYYLSSWVLAPSL
jgi:phosphate/sulfate permease